MCRKFGGIPPKGDASIVVERRLNDKQLKDLQGFPPNKGFT
jgi:hypothetical protein